MPTHSDTSTLSTHTAMGRYTKYRYTCPNHTDRYKTGTSIVQVSAIQVHSGTSIRYTRTRFRRCTLDKAPKIFFLAFESMMGNFAIVALAGPVGGPLLQGFGGIGPAYRLTHVVWQHPP